MVFQGSLMGVSMKYQGCFMRASRIRSFMSVSRGISRKIEGCFENVSRAIQISIKDNLTLKRRGGGPNGPQQI